MIKKTIFFSLFLVFFFGAVFPPEFYSQAVSEPPKTIKDAEDVGKDFMDKLPHEMEKGWDEALTIWTKMYYRGKSFWEGRVKYRVLSFWNNQVKSRAIIIWNKIKRKSKEQISQKKDVLVDEFQKDKQFAEEVIKEGTKEVSKSLWLRILEGIGIKRKE